MNRYQVSFGGSTIRVEYDPGRPTEIIKFLFHNIKNVEDDNPTVTLRLEDRGQEKGLWLWQGNKHLFSELTSEAMAAQLMSQVCFLLAYESQRGLLLHAAGVGCEKFGLVMVGNSGAGKSTLTAWLIGQGLKYLSDELVFIPNNSAVAVGFSRPITIKSPARRFLSNLVDTESLSSGIMRSESLDVIDPVLLKGEVEQDKTIIKLILFPNYKAGHKTELVSLTKAQASFKLMQCLANARNLADHGFSEVARVASLAPAYTLTYGDTGGAGRTILDLIKAVKPNTVVSI